jgi:16S rRNA (uracil1498-N3)-methyltransferase
MSAHRFFLTAPLPLDPGAPLPLTQADVRHAVSVLRVQPGELIDVVEPDSRVWSTQVVSVDMESVHAKVLGQVTESFTPDLTLFQGVAKGDKMDDVVRQAVEIGAMRVVPVLCGRSVVRLDAGKRVARGERWRRIAESAAKQSKRTLVPAVDNPVDFRDVPGLIADFDGAVVAWEDSRDDGVFDVVVRMSVAGASRVAVFIGPEGGLSAEEVDLLRDAGAVSASLGPSILRTETAAIVALTLASAALGGMGASRG